MEAKHTPGPWEWNKYGNDDETVTKMQEVGIKPTLSLTNDGSAMVKGISGPAIAFVCLRRDDLKSKDKWEATDSERDANARLIAAAPELLAACEAIITGVAYGKVDFITKEGPYYQFAGNSRAILLTQAAIAKANKI